MINILLCEKVYSRWLILLIDQLIITWALSMSFLIIHGFEYAEMLTMNQIGYAALFNAISISVFIAMRIHTGIIRYSNTEDIVRVFSAVLVCNVIYWLVIQSLVLESSSISRPHFLRIILLNFFTSSTLLIMLRLGVKSVFNIFKNTQKTIGKTILIYGSDQSSVLIKQAFKDHKEINYDVLGFIDDNLDKVGKYIEQKKVYHSSSIANLKKKCDVTDLVVNSNCMNTNSKRQTINQCIELGINVLTVPPADQWIDGQLSRNQIKNLNIEDLLQRQPIVLNKTNIYNQITGKRVLITGAAGSIGSEIVRQVIGYDPEQIILCDQAESPLHELQLELEDKQLSSRVRVCITNIQNFKTLHSIFNEYKPQIVFHAAAYKHVPMMESNPSEAILDNVLGTKNVADISIEFGVEKFIMISTDKAVNPTNVMGASKRLAEMYIQSLNNLRGKSFIESELLHDLIFVGPHSSTNDTKFITTRFGNVLGSNGSVIPRFKSQIERGGPVTVTHPEITRYFMTITEAVQLVLEAGAMGKGGEIFIFDMGEPVKIADLAANMIKLAGLIPGKDIQIQFTGLRPGEKLYEELLNKEEYSIPTHNQKIKISSVILYPYDYMQQKIKELLQLNETGNELKIVRKMKEIVPEYKSHNSRFVELDYVLENSN